MLEVEAVERPPEVLALAQDRQPREAGLEAFETELFEEAPVVVDRKAPLGVVVGLVLGRGGAPEATDDAVVAFDEPVVGQSSVPFGVSQVMASTVMRPARMAGSCSVSLRVSSSPVR